jgi:hypothetical protein
MNREKSSWHLRKLGSFQAIRLLSRTRYRGGYISNKYELFNREESNKWNTNMGEQ